MSIDNIYHDHNFNRFLKQTAQGHAVASKSATGRSLSDTGARINHVEHRTEISQLFPDGRGLERR
ncbi:MAG TPA: hypothetical protein VF315_07825, partial [Steroidobacteraceae bacterium]